MGLIADYIMQQVKERREDELAERQRQSMLNLFGGVGAQQPQQQAGLMAQPQPQGIGYTAQGGIEGMLQQQQGGGIAPPVEQPQQQPGGLMAQGGLMGQNGRPDFMRFGQGLMMIPGMEQMGGQFLMQGMKNRYKEWEAAEARRRAPKPLSPEEQHAQDMAEAARKAQVEQYGKAAGQQFAQLYGVESKSEMTEPQRITAVNQIQTNFQRDTKGAQNTIELVNGVNETLTKKGGSYDLNMPESEQVARSFIKSLTPNEAYMGDDRAAVESSGRFGGSLRYWQSIFSGKGKLDKTVAQQMHTVMQRNANRAQGYIEDRKSFATGVGEGLNMPDLPHRTYKPYQTPGAQQRDEEGRIKPPSGWSDVN